MQKNIATNSAFGWVGGKRKLSKDILSKEIGDRKVLNIDVANALGINYNNFKSVKSRGKSIPHWEIMQFLARRGISINMFFFGQTVESIVESTNKYTILKYQSTINASAGGGADNHFLNQQDIVLDNTLLDHIQSTHKYTEIITAVGDSMYPIIQDNSLLFVDRSCVEINPKDIFVLSTTDELVVKKIDVRDNIFILKSINQEYVDMEFNLEDILVVGKVKGVFYKV